MGYGRLGIGVHAPWWHAGISKLVWQFLETLPELLYIYWKSHVLIQFPHTEKKPHAKFLACELLTELHMPTAHIYQCLKRLVQVYYGLYSWYYFVLKFTHKCFCRVLMGPNESKIGSCDTMCVWMIQYCSYTLNI